MSFIFKMPDLGEGILEGEIVQWFVKEGDTIEADAPLLEVQNDKMLQEVPSPVSGKITKILVEAGNVATVGDSLIEFDGDGKAVSEEETSDGFIFKMPDLGEGILEGEIVQWFVKEGDSIEADATLLEVQNDKMLQEVPSPVSGKVTKILVEAGNVATVGDSLIEFDGEGKVVSEEPVTKAAPSTPASPPAKAPQATEEEIQYASNTIAGRILAMPSVRQYARENDVDLTTVQASGKHGHVTRDDVTNFLSRGPVVETVAKETVVEEKVEKSAPIVTKGETTREKMSITRQAIAKAMVTSKTKAPHVTLFDEIDVTKLMAHRSKFKAIALEQEIRLTYLAYIVKAVVAVVRKYPVLNASIDETTNEIVYKNFYNVGIAVDTEAGLYVPNIKNADSKSVFAIAKEISELATLANEGTLKGPDMREGTITISNIGSARGLWFTPVINYPEVAIFGIGRIDKKPVVLEDDTIGVGNVMALSLSFDHRIVDGATAQLAMNEFKRVISDPDILLMEV